MCGRYDLDIETAEMKKIVDELSKKCPDKKVDVGEIFPRSEVPILLQRDDELEFEIARWGLPLSKGKGEIINARAESVEEKVTFRESFFERRCVVPATAFFEWTKSENPKVKYAFSAADEKLIYMAGIYREVDGEKRFVILTTSANAFLADVHDRMPLLLTKDVLDKWILSIDEALELLKANPPHLEKKHV